MRFKQFFKLQLVAVLTLLLLQLPISRINASQIEPIINEFEITTGETINSYLTYTNSESIPVQISLEAHHYNEFLNNRDNTIIHKEAETPESAETIFITFPNLESKELTVDPNSKVEILYRISVPDDMVPGTYYNLIGIVAQPLASQEEVDNQPGIKTRSGIGVKVKIDVTKGDYFPTAQAKENLGINFFIENPGNLFSPTEFTVELVNDSNYTYTPIGNIEILGEWKDKEPISLDFNKNEEEISPGDSLRNHYSVRLWDIKSVGDLINLTEKKVINVKIIPDKRTMLTASEEIRSNSTLIWGFFGLLIALVLFLILKSFPALSGTSQKSEPGRNSESKREK